MSEEEIIKKVNTLIRFNEQDEKISYNDFELMPNRTNYQALKGLLDLYNKEKEKNKKIEDKIKEIIDKIDGEDYYCLNEAEEDLRKLVE